MLTVVKQSCISRFRTELMGLSAIGVLIVHIPETELCPGWLQRMFSWCGMAVFIFMFLSGIGLYYSMSGSEENSSLSDFYRRRLSRVIFPYWMMAGVWYGITCLLLERNLWQFLCEMSTISFWTEHSSPWFVATLIPIYLLYPFYYRWVEKGNRGRKTLLSSTCVIIVISIIFQLSVDLYKHLGQAINSFWVFMLGSYYGRKVKEGSNLQELIVYFVVVLVLVKLVPAMTVVIPGKLILYAAEGLFVMVTAALVLKSINCQWLCRILRWFGKHSLELYLTTQFLAKACKYFGIRDSLSGIQEYVLYGVIVILGLTLSALILPLEKRLVKIVWDR